MAMAGRHIRWDWQQFVSWEQKSVRTLCNKTSTWNATGIPGVTEQSEIVEAGGKKVYGWCTICARDAYVTCVTVINKEYDEPVHPYIMPMYEAVAEITGPIYDAYVKRQEQLREKYRRLDTYPRGM